MDMQTTQGAALRVQAYVEHLNTVTGHADRLERQSAYCTGLLLPGERKGVKPMAARIAPGDVGAKHQSFHPFVAKAPWDEARLLAATRDHVLPKMDSKAPIRAWIVKDTGIPKKDKHSAAVATKTAPRTRKTIIAAKVSG
jgi:SRSO17 transposase